MNPFPMAARVSVAAAVLALSGCYYVGPYPYGYYGAAPYPAYPGYPSAAPSGATQRDPGLEQTNPPAGPEPEDANPNANYDGAGPPPPNGQSQPPAPAAGYAQPPVVVAPAYYPAYPAYYPPYYGYGYGYGYPGWWGPSVSFRFGFGGHGGYHHH